MDIRSINSDAERRLRAAIDWLTQHNGCNLISDDNGHWAVSTSGYQPVPTDPPGDMDIVSLVSASEWRATILDAIEAAQAGEVDK